jgi:hypothetical protein
MTPPTQPRAWLLILFGFLLGAITMAVMLTR